jgi:hypothetical protein
MAKRPLEYSIVESDSKAATLKRLRQFALLLDSVITIPGTKVSIGLDPLIGLLPGAGDFLGVMLSAYIVLEAARMGASKATLGRMVFNIIIDGVLGAVPVLGDFFDIAWTANIHNMKLLEEHAKFPSQNKSADKWFIFVVLATLFLFAIGLIALPVLLIRLVLGN